MLSSSFSYLVLFIACTFPLNYAIETNHYVDTTVASFMNTTDKINITAINFGHDLSHGFARFAAFCFLLTIIISVSCNFILIATVIGVQKLHSFTHVLIVNMAISDLITAVGTIPFDVEYMLRGYFAHGEIPCGIMHTTFLISLPSSVLCLTLLTAERYISIVFSFHVTKMITKKRLNVVVAVTWCYVLVVALFPMMYDKNAVSVQNGNCLLNLPLGYQIYQLVANFLIPMIFICVVNIILYMVAHKHANKTVETMLGTFFDSSEEISNNNISPRKKTSCIVMPLSLARNIKAAKRIALLVGVFLVCWLIYIILVATNISCRCHPRELTWMANIINYSSTAINPVLYGLMNKNIRGEVFKTLKRMRRSCMSCLYGNCLNGKRNPKSTFELNIRSTTLRDDSHMLYTSN
jgi:hypothetical protein